MEFKTAIVDELGYIVYWCCDITNEKKERILSEHPEWAVKCIQM